VLKALVEQPGAQEPLTEQLKQGLLQRACTYLFGGAGTRMHAAAVTLEAERDVTFLPPRAPAPAAAAARKGGAAAAPAAVNGGASTQRSGARAASQEDWGDEDEQPRPRGLGLGGSGSGKADAGAGPSTAAPAFVSAGAPAAEAPTEAVTEEAVGMQPPHQLNARTSAPALPASHSGGAGGADTAMAGHSAPSTSGQPRTSSADGSMRLDGGASGIASGSASIPEGVRAKRRVAHAPPPLPQPPPAPSGPAGADMQSPGGSKLKRGKSGDAAAREKPAKRPAGGRGQRIVPGAPNGLGSAASPQRRKNGSTENGRNKSTTGGVPPNGGVVAPPDDVFAKFSAWVWRHECEEHGRGDAGAQAFRKWFLEQTCAHKLADLDADGGA
jgi:hypothetical protein